MIIDILYSEYQPEQFQHVRKLTFEVSKDKLLVEFKEPAFGQMRLSLEDIKIITVTED